jgi:hypothetical protein
VRADLERYGRGIAEAREIRGLTPFAAIGQRMVSSALLECVSRGPLDSEAKRATVNNFENATQLHRGQS